MKLVYCWRCGDIFGLRVSQERTCECGSSGGVYLDKVNAEYWGPVAVPIGILNESLAWEIAQEEVLGKSGPISAFVIPEDSETMRRREP